MISRRTQKTTATRARLASGDVLCLALTSPERLTPNATSAITADLDRRPSDEAIVGALGALAALLYARPDLVRRAHVASLARLMLGPISPGIAPAAASAWQCLAVSTLARQAANALGDLLGGSRLNDVGRRALLEAWPSYARWRPDTLDLETTLRAANVCADHAARDLILREVIEPLAHCSPRAFTRARVDRVVTTFGGRPRLRYTLGHLVTRAGLPADGRARAERWLRHHRPIPSVRPLLDERPFATLIVHNIVDGQGDEIVKVMPILQSLLDSSPTLTATVLTTRAYLYDHPRVTPSAILNDGVVDQAFRATWDGIVDFNARTVPGVSTRPELESRVTRYLATRQPKLVIRAITGRHHFTFETVRLGRQRVASTLGLDRVDLENAYDPSERLMIDLGMPLGSRRVGSPLVGRPSEEAAATWTRLRGRGSRPAALVNAFGGAHPLKGFTRDKAARLGAELTGLVDEGYTVILLPNGQPWGRRDTIGSIVRHVARRATPHVRVARDPAAPGEAFRGASSERPDVSGADRVMRLFKYFASYADLVVTVEGWLMHCAYAMRRPFRLFMAPSSPINFLPRGRGQHQRLVLSMSRLSAPDDEDLLGVDDPPPLPSCPRKLMLMTAARSLGTLGDARSNRLLLKIGASPDSELRAVALETLAHGGLTPTVRARLDEALRDPEAPVRAAAARALLRSVADDERHRDAGYRARLHAHVALARQDWTTIGRLGVAALPALAAATDETDPTLRREARWAAAQLIRRHGPGPSSTPRL